MITLGIESSCDETSVAILEDETILANSTYTQIEHAEFGGVVPELASRSHLEKIDRLAGAVLSRSSLTPADIDLIAVTDRPGLAGALLVGISFALGLHSAYGIPVSGINHLEGHVCAVFFEEPPITFPFLALIVSGGHTSLYLVGNFGEYELLGETIDDAAGEAFDKVGKMLGFPYPAGRRIESEAARFTGSTRERPAFPVARCSRGELHFSFSGLKTAVKYRLSGLDPGSIASQCPAICSAFQQTVADTLVGRAVRAAELTGVHRIAMVGGVACNNHLREELRRRFPGTVHIPPADLCTDNAAMIAMAGYRRSRAGILRFPRMNPSSPL